VLVAVALIAALAPGRRHGPEAASGVQRRQADQSATTFGDVVVTARRREEAVRDVPSTITAIGIGPTGAKGPIEGVGDLLADRARRALQRPAE
jgi:iron complex outermembrane receptor protein